RSSKPGRSACWGRRRGAGRLVPALFLSRAMTDDLIDHGKFLLQGPVWVLVDEARSRTRALPQALALWTAADTGQFLPVFTDEDLAGRFGEAAGDPAKRPLRLPTLRALRALLVDLQRAGLQKVGIDVSLTPTPSSEEWLFLRTLQGQPLNG